jgi:exopolysaccharide production protein ExoQ
MLRGSPPNPRVSMTDGSTPASAPATTSWLRDDKYALLGSLLVFGVFYYMSVSPTLFQHNVVDVGGTPAPNPLNRALKIILLAGSASVIFWRYRLAWQVLKKVNVFMLAFMGLAVSSIFWSISPLETITRLVNVCVALSVCLGFTLVGWHRTRFQDIARPLLTTLLVASLVYGLLAPDLAIEKGNDISLSHSWKGIFTQKNQLGEAASLGTILWIHAWFSKEIRLTAFLIGGGISATLLLLSRSSTALFATLFVAMLLFLLLRNVGRPRHRSTKYLVVISALVLVVYSLAALDLVPSLNFLLEPITAITGKDASFSGRTAIWALVRERIVLHPALGTGYGAFWTGDTPDSPSYYVRKTLYMYPSEAHNGYLDVINDLGVAGLACLIAYIVSYMRRSLALLKHDFAEAALFLAMLLQQLIGNMSESMWMNSFTLGFVVLSLATFALARSQVQEQLEAGMEPAVAAPSGVGGGLRQRPRREQLRRSSRFHP